MLARYAVIGAPIEKSLSPELHQQFAKSAGISLRYDKIVLDEMQFEAQVKAFFESGGKGLNVTAPGKVRAFNLSEIKTERCLKAGAANTLWQDDKGRLCADNTDGIGFIKAMKKHVTILDKRILCLGRGGAFRGILPVLLDENPRKISVYSRSSRLPVLPSVQYEPLDSETAGYDIVINATGVCIANLAYLKGQPFCYDLSYDISGVTPFVQWARNKGYAARDGFGMLAAQAAEAFSVWHGVAIPY